MAARGSEAKTSITNQILKAFPGSFVYNLKEIRIPFVENGEVIEIKVALTAAKESVGGLSPSDINAFDDSSIEQKVESSVVKAPIVEETKLTEPTEEEKDRLAKLLESF